MSDIITALTMPELAKSRTTPKVDMRLLLEGLNHDLAGEYQAVLMYTQYSAKLTGPHRLPLRALFQQEIAEEQAHAQFLSDKIAAMGGEPTVEPRKVPRADQPQAMLSYAHAAEVEAIQGYCERISQAEEFGDIGLRVVLESMVADETRHKEEIERVLANWEEFGSEQTDYEHRWIDDGGQG